MCGASKCIFSMLFPTMICSKFQETLTWKDRYQAAKQKESQTREYICHVGFCFSDVIRSFLCYLLTNLSGCL